MYNWNLSGCNSSVQKSLLYTLYYDVLKMENFVRHDSVVREIWGKSDTVLFIFAGAAAEFALNKAVDWLYFTGRLPADPLGRLFSTVNYAKMIVFSPTEQANQAIDRMSQIHSSVEQNRGSSIPDWAYRDVLFMLIHYSIAAYELLERQLSNSEKEEVHNVFFRVGLRMSIKDLPATYEQWILVREQHLVDDLQKSEFTKDLFRQYKKHLGGFRYMILIESQKLVLPAHAKKLLGFGDHSLLSLLLPIYKLSRVLKLDNFLKNLILPSAYSQQIKELDVNN